MSNKKLLECLVCENKFSEKDVEELRFFPEQMMCFADYYKMYKAEHRVWCFGKENLTDEAGKVIRFGFDPTGSVDCKKFCPDRKICRMFVTREIFRYRKLLKTTIPFRGNLRRIFVTCVVGTSKKKLEERIISEGGDPIGVFKKLRKGRDPDDTNSIRWTLIEREDKIRIKIKG